MDQQITKFEGEYRFLSNFYPAVVYVGGYPFLTVEHAYQASKTFSIEHITKISLCKSPATAKQLGRRVPLRNDWESVKIMVMQDLLRQKFTHADLRVKLLATGTAELIEGNWWNDTFWGVCNGKGQNWLGRLLMIVRSQYAEMR